MLRLLMVWISVRFFLIGVFLGISIVTFFKQDVQVLIAYFRFGSVAIIVTFEISVDVFTFLALEINQALMVCHVVTSSIFALW
ncbi:hypothetical protein D3C76_1374530 [compost metagenome]